MRTSNKNNPEVIIAQLEYAYYTSLIIRNVLLGVNIFVEYNNEYMYFYNKTSEQSVERKTRLFFKRHNRFSILNVQRNLSPFVHRLLLHREHGRVYKVS